MAVVMIVTGAALPCGSYVACAADGSVHYIAVASDRHENTNAIKAAMAGMPSGVEYVCLNGDMSNFASNKTAVAPGRARAQDPYNTSDVLSEVQDAFPKLGSDSVSIIYADHDANATDDADIMKCINVADDGTKPIPTASAADDDSVSKGASGLIFEGPDGDGDDDPDYYVYGVSFYDMTNTGVSESTQAFMDFADQTGDENAPIIVIGHVPIHSKRGDNLGATYWSEALNYAATGSETVENTSDITRDVCYIYGHNHTVDKKEYISYPGESLDIQAPADDGAAVNSVIGYTYLTGGYLNENHTSTLVTVENGQLSFNKYKGYIVRFDTQGGSDVDAEGVHEGSLAARPSHPKRDGYHFTGWFKEAACENEWDFSRDTVNSDTTIYAGWVKGTKPDAVKISTIEYASKKKIKVKWSGSEGADDYRVSYRKAGTSKWNRLWANGKTAVNLTGLTSKGLYEIKVNAVKESGDRIIYSDDSNIPHRYISAVSKVKAKGKKKAVKVSWKKDKSAGGYEISYATNKKMKNAVTVKVSSKKSSYKIKKLKSGKRYYVRVRPVRKKNGVKYNGEWSGRRSVKTK